MTSGGWMTPHYGMIKENRGEGIILLLYLHILRSLFFLFEFYDLYSIINIVFPSYFSDWVFQSITAIIGNTGESYRIAFDTRQYHFIHPMFST